MMASALLPVEMAASAPPRIQNLISGPDRPVDVLGRFATALYLRLAGQEVIALLSSDAVRLPIGLILPTWSRELRLGYLGGPVLVGSGAVRIGDWSCRVSRPTSPKAPADLAPDRNACEHLRHRLVRYQSGHPVLSLPDALLDDARSPEVAADLVRRLLGVGPGLTPAGDDVLAGLLVGLWSFGQRAEPLRLAVLAGLPAGTTDLSAALLRCAARGESIPEVNQLLRTMSGSEWQVRLDHAIDDLVRVGHTSGAALATGVWAAATIAIGHGHRHRWPRIGREVA
jgi:Protein of unknown function (DUF2877)